MEQNKNIFQSIGMTAKVFVIVLTVFVGLKAVAVLKEYSYIGSGPGQANYISVQGTGEVLATPDIAEFTYTITEEASTAAAASDKAATKGNAVLAAVKASGVKEEDIKTVSYNLSPKYDYKQTIIACQTGFSCPQPTGKQVIIGYEVSQSVQVKVRKIDDAGTVIAKISANVSNVSGVNFVVDKPDMVQQEAREKAIVDAQKKAKVLAKQLGVKIVRVSSFSDNQGGMYYQKAYASAAGSAMMSDATAISELSIGQNTVTSNVTVTYEIR